MFIKMLIRFIFMPLILQHKFDNNSVILLLVTPVVFNTTFSGSLILQKFLNRYGAQLVEPLFYSFTLHSLLTT